MHRVELKENLKETFRVQVGVPNAPCGVESSTRTWANFKGYSFLMHRVELKVLVDVLEDREIGSS